MDNFELNTFSIESNIDWDKLLDADALASSQASQQSDYLRNVDLGFDISEFEFLQNSESFGDVCFSDVKQEPDSPMDDVVDQQLYPGSDATPQQLSPGVTIQQWQAFIPSNEEGIIDQNVYVGTVLPETVQEFSDQVYPGDVEPAEEELVDLEVSAAITSSPSGVADSTTLDLEGVYTAIRNPPQNRISRPTRQTQREPSLFTDEYLRRVGTKEFNRRIQEVGITAEEAKKWKRRRRTLKNRGYAQNCRQRRIGKHQEADEENSRLRRELAEERARSARLRQRVADLENALSAVRSRNGSVGNS